MAKDNQILVRVNDPTHNAVEAFADDRDYNKAEAVRRIVESRLRSEGYLNREHYGGDELMADGGQVVRPFLNLMGAIYAAASITLFLGLTVVAFTGIRLPIPVPDLLGMMISGFLLTAAIMLVLYTDLPEWVDRRLASGVRRITLVKRWVP